MQLLPPILRACVRPAERSSSEATSSSNPTAAWARCQTRRSGSASRSPRGRFQVRRPRGASSSGRRPAPPSADLNAGLDELEAAGVPIDGDRSAVWARFAARRAEYEPPVLGFLEAAPAPWSSDRSPRFGGRRSSEPRVLDGPGTATATQRWTISPQATSGMESAVAARVCVAHRTPPAENRSESANDPRASLVFFFFFFFFMVQAVVRGRSIDGGVPLAEHPRQTSRPHPPASQCQPRARPCHASRGPRLARTPPGPP